jgi:hypothetical protein
MEQQQNASSVWLVIIEKHHYQYLSRRYNRGLPRHQSMNHEYY